MTPIAKFNNATNAVQSNSKLSSGLGHIAVGGVLGSDLANQRFGQLGLSVLFTNNVWQTCKASVKRVFGVALGIAPFQISDVIVSRVAVDVVNKWQSVRVEYKSLSHQAMNKARMFSAIFSKVNPVSKISSMPMLVKGKPPAIIQSLATVFADLGLFRVCPNPTIIGDCIKTFKPGNIFHIHSEPHCLRSTMLLPRE